MTTAIIQINDLGFLFEAVAPLVMSQGAINEWLDKHGGFRILSLGKDDFGAMRYRLYRKNHVDMPDDRPSWNYSTYSEALIAALDLIVSGNFAPMDE